MSSVRLKLGLLLALAASTAGCSPFHHSTAESELVTASKHVLVTGLNVPEVHGVQGCGAQALATMIHHVDPSAPPEVLAAELPWHDIGATPVDLLLEARRRGFEARIERGTIDTLNQTLRGGQPALIMLDAGVEVRGLFMRWPTLNVMHWAVVSGIANDSSSVLLAARRQRHHVASRKDFERRWSQSDNCMIIVQPRENTAALNPSSTPP
jgi:ABC-type bacteriocin/lantibiotic exporter with double-glycine peptidase domain